jgi:diguanylate cyclase (GGDEF)-like protein/PAS domain S-box-containing protein
MSTQPAGITQDFEALQARNRKLAEDKAYLQLVIRLIERLNPTPGLEDMVSDMLSSIVETIGGTNIRLWFWIDSELHYTDFLGVRKTLDAIDDPLAAMANEQGTFVEQESDSENALLRDGVIPGAWTWAFPLRAGVERVGVIKLENLHISSAHLRNFLPIFFSHAALLLGGEIRNLLRQRAEATLRESERKLSVILESVDAYIYLKDKQGQYLFANRPVLELFNASLDQVVGQGDERFFDADSAAKLRENDSRVLIDGETLRREETNRSLNDGHDSTYLSVKLPLRNEAGEIYALCGISTDITERKQAEQKLQLAASVFTHAREGIMITDPGGTIIEVNEAFSQITGYGRAEVIGRNPRLLKSGQHPAEFYAAMWRSLLDNGYWYGEIWNRRKNGEFLAEMETISAVLDAQGQVTQYVSLFSDITRIKEHERELEHIAHYDALTSLPNRVFLADRLHQAMAQAIRRNQKLAVVYLDLDGFKAVNDRYGHDAGDQLLITLSSRMKQCLREGDTLARLGGDEFVAVMLDLTDIEACLPMLSRLLAAASEPVLWGTSVLQVSASVGVTFYPQTEETDADQLMRQADQAMYQAKVSGKNRFHLFDADQDRSIRGHHESLERIRRALIEHEFVLYYQPKVNMRLGTLVGAEALIRWRHPIRGLMSPGEFLPVIEDHSLAIELGEWVLDSALSQIEQWRVLGLDIPISVNVGARQLQQADFVERLQLILAAHPQVAPGKLELEVLETSALEDLAHISRVIAACLEIGVSFALDDFGTGYSSLTYLKRLPVAQIKIDQSFVRDMLHDPDDLAIVESVLGLATAFRRQTIAEGVETREHGEMLLQLGCELAQGYGIARPMPASELPAWAAVWKPFSSWVDLLAVSRDDLPILFAAVEHRAWIVAIEAYIQGEVASQPQLDHQLCRFGQWLNSYAIASQSVRPALHNIEALHRQVHGLGERLIQLLADGRQAEASAGLTELHRLRDDLLASLWAFMRRKPD